MRTVDLSIVVPAFNEAARIGSSLRRLVAALDPAPFTWEVHVVDDGSSDRTAAIVGGAAAADTRIGLQRAPHRGKGAAARAGLLAVAGRRRFLCDADLSMPPSALPRLLEHVPGTLDIAIGSREGPSAHRIGEPVHRHLLGRVFNRLVGLSVLPGIRDTQCGFKLFSAAAAERILPLTTIDGWGFDVELLVIARLQDWRVGEVPIEWHYGKASKLRVLRHSLEMLHDLRQIRRNLDRGVYGRPEPVPCPWSATRGARPHQARTTAAPAGAPTPCTGRSPGHSCGPGGPPRPCV